MLDGESVLLKTTASGRPREFFAIVSDHELHTDLGILKLGELRNKSFGDTIVSHLGQVLVVQKPRAPDFFRHARRTGAPMMPKDIGMIVGHTGLCSSDSVLDAGTGSGVLAIYLGFISKRVVTCEKREEFVEIARRNIEAAGLKNVEVRHGDILKEIGEMREKFDVVTLDTVQAAEIVPLVPRVLQPGGFLVTYSPFFEQTKDIRIAIDKEKFSEIHTFEAIEREISFGSRGSRPSTFRIGHTGFITIARK